MLFRSDPRVRGTLTISSEKALPPTEAWRSYLAALRGLGFTVVENAGLLKVVPEAEAKLQAGTVSVGAPSARGDQILTQIFRLNHENPNNLVAVLRPLISANNTINANPGNGTLVITDYADNLQRLAKIIAALDQPAASEVEVVPLKHALASEMQPLVQKLAESSATPAAPGAAASTGSATSVLVEPRSNSLIIRAANPARLASVKALIDKLDRPARFKSTDITYVMQENLVIAGGAGGYLLDEASGDPVARATGRLVIDPGAVVKLMGARIELERGNSQLIAEGTPLSRIIFTSLADNRYGAGGTFDTNGNAPDVRAPGD